MAHSGTLEGRPLIAEHGLIGDLQTAALVTTDGTLDWFCSHASTRQAFRQIARPRRRLLPDCARRRAGRGQAVVLPDSAVLITRFMSRTVAG